MHFSFPPWVFFPKFRENLSRNEGQFFGVEVSDPFIERLFIHFLKKEDCFRNAISVDGKDLEPDWFDRNLASLDLFSANDPFIITKAEKISEDFFSCFVENYSKISRKVVFVFCVKSKYFQKLAKKYDRDLFLSIQAPKFWEREQFFCFLVNTLGVLLSSEIEAYLLKSLSENSSSYVKALNLLKLHYGPDCREVSLEEVKTLIPPESIDSFFMADLFCVKKHRTFWRKLLEIDAQEGDFQEFFGFMQSHLIKLADTTYLKEKNKLTSYDRKIISQNKLWDKVDIQKSLRLFGELQICAKRSLKEVYLKMQVIETRACDFHK